MRQRTQDIDFVAKAQIITLSVLADLPYFVFLFGSRVSQGHPSRSDIDIGVWGNEPLPPNLWHKIRNLFDESDIPLKVDIIDFSLAEKDFIDTAIKKTILWQKPANFPKNSSPYNKLWPPSLRP